MSRKTNLSLLFSRPEVSFWDNDKSSFLHPHLAHLETLPIVS